MNELKVGDHVVLYHDLADPEAKIKGQLTTLKGDVCTVDGKGPFYISYVWPARVEEKLDNIVKERYELKRKFDQSISMVFDLRNQLSRGDL